MDEFSNMLVEIPTKEEQESLVPLFDDIRYRRGMLEHFNTKAKDVIDRLITELEQPVIENIDNVLTRQTENDGEMHDAQALPCCGISKSKQQSSWPKHCPVAGSQKANNNQAGPSTALLRNLKKQTTIKLAQVLPLMRNLKKQTLISRR